jgi:protein subunit release factor B
VVLKHLPTNLVVRVHDSRDQLVNRKLARKLLYDNLDVMINGYTSKIAMRDARVARTKDRARRKREKREKGVSGEASTGDGSESVSEEGEDSDDEDYSRYDDIKLDKVGKDIK